MNKTEAILDILVIVGGLFCVFLGIGIFIQSDKIEGLLIIIIGFLMLKD